VTDSTASPVALDPALQALSSSVPLLPGSGPLEVFADVVQLGGAQVELVGLVSECDGAGCVGSAAAIGAKPWHRAYYEVLERQSIVSAKAGTGPLTLRDPAGVPCADVERSRVFVESADPTRWRHALSNGVALAPDWERACERALAEAVERDAVLLSWFGPAAWGSDAAATDFGFEPLPASDRAVWAHLESLYELELRQVSWREHTVVAAVGFPRAPHVPTCLSFAARRERGAAAAAAYSEFLQRAGFLWGEELPTSAPEPQPNADYHQEQYLWPSSQGALRRWLRDGRLPRVAPEAASPDVYVDLTPPHLAGRIAVARCHRPSWMPLVFGSGFGGYPASAPLHPIA